MWPPVQPTSEQMDLTQPFLMTKHPCASGLRRFLRHYENGTGYQPLLDALVDAGRVSDAGWLLSQRSHK